MVPKPEGRVLVVEDDPLARELLRQEIAELAADVRAHADVTGARLELTSWTPDVLVTDLCLPDGDGVELARLCRERCPRASVVLITGYATLETAVAAVRLGVFAYLRKDCDDPDEVKATVAAALRAARSSRAPQPEPGAFLDLLAAPALLVDARRRILALNALAKQLDWRGAGFDTKVGAPIGELLPRAFTRRVDTQLTSMLERACRLASPALVGALRMAPPDLGAVPQPVAVVALGRGNGEEGLAVLTAGGRRRSDEQWSTMVGAAYGLSVAESRVAWLLTEGLAPDQIAAQLNVTMATIRSHLKRLFVKTSTSRQAELVAELLGGPVLRHLPASRLGGEDGDLDQA